MGALHCVFFSIIDSVARKVIFGSTEYAVLGIDVLVPLQAQQKEFEEFTIRSTYSRNEGLFFKNLYAAPVPLRSSSTIYKSKYKEVNNKLRPRCSGVEVV
jgi:hypothetical protein